MAKSKINDDIISIQAQGSGYISEIEAKVPWSLGVNAKNCLRRDAFLVNFIPKITPGLMERHGWQNRGEMEQAIKNDTRLLGQITEEAIKDMDATYDWTETISEAHMIRQDTKDLLDFIAIYHKYKYMDKDLTEKQLNSHYRDYKNAVAFVQRQADLIKTKKEEYGKMSESAEKMKVLTALRREEHKLYTAQAAIAKAKFTLVANNRFDFTKEPDDITAEEYVAKLVAERKEKIKVLKDKYMQKYKAIPKYLEVYEQVVDNLAEQMFLTSTPNLDKFKLMVEKDTEQYTSILEDGPNVILQCARIYPTLQQNLEYEILFEKGEGGRASLQLEPGSEFKAIHDMPFPFTGMLGNEFETVLDAPADKTIISLVGPPGIGKTAMMESVARQMGFLFKSISIPHCDSSLFGGLATITNDDQVKQLASQDMADAITDYGIIDLEEATAAPDNSVHLQMARFLQTGAIGINRQIHPLTVCVMTSNDNVMDNADIKPFSTVIMNRIETQMMKNPAKLLNKWCSWVLHNPTIQGDPEAAETYNYIITFLKFDPAGRYYDGVSPESLELRSTQEGLANPTFRSWKNFADKVKMIVGRKDLSIEQRAEFIRKNGVGIIGPAATEKFVEHYLVSAKLPSIDELLGRMKNSTQPWRIVDTIRVFDMGGNLKDNMARGNRFQNTEEDAAPSTGGRRKKYRYSLGLTKEDNDRLIKAVNDNFIEEWKVQENVISYARKNWEINNPGKTFDPKTDTLEKETNELLEEILSGHSVMGIRPPRKTDDSVLMPAKVLEENYNKIWGSDEIDINNSAVLFSLSNQITSRLDRIYEEAYYNNRPIDGKQLNQLFMLAMTIPAKDFRSALIADLVYKAFSNDKLGIYYKNGIVQRDNSGKDILIKWIPKHYVDRATGKLEQVDKEAETERLRKEGTWVAQRILTAIPAAKLLENVSQGFKMRDDEDKAQKRQQELEAEGPSL